MSGKTVICLLLLAGLGTAWLMHAHPNVFPIAKTWIETRIGGGDSNYQIDQFITDLVDRVNYARKTVKLPPIKLDKELEAWLEKTAPAINSNDLAGFVELLQVEQPRYFQVNASHSRHALLRDLAEQFTDFTSVIDPKNGHMAVLVREILPTRMGYEAILVVGQRLEDLSPAVLNERRGDTFFATCPHCKFQHACRVAPVQRGITLDCPQCGRLYDAFAPDDQGRFRRVNEYLQGYEPPANYAAESNRLHELYTIWSAVVGGCQYSKDTNDRYPTRDAWQLPLQTITRGKGDCEDSALLLADWLMSRGFEVRVALGRYGDMGQHAWCVAKVDGIDYLLESTEGSPNPDKPAYAADVGSRYVPDLLFDRTHLYVRAKPRERFDGSYWGTRTWVTLTPKDDATQILAEASKSATAAASRPISTGIRPRNTILSSLHPLSFEQLRLVPRNSDTWQVPLVIPPPKAQP